MKKWQYSLETTFFGGQYENEVDLDLGLGLIFCDIRPQRVYRVRTYVLAKSDHIPRSHQIKR
jgi:hypothetical protein